MGCNLEYQNIDDKENLKIENDKTIEGILFIDSDLDFYSPYMSSVPGLPLKGRFESDNIVQNVRYHWITEYGSFLSWADNGVISELGSDFCNSGEKIYWSPEPFVQDDVIKKSK